MTASFLDCFGAKLVYLQKIGSYNLLFQQYKNDRFTYPCGRKREWFLSSQLNGAVIARSVLSRDLLVINLHVRTFTEGDIVCLGNLVWASDAKSKPKIINLRCN